MTRVLQQKLILLQMWSQHNYDTLYETNIELFWNYLQLFCAHRCVQYKGSNEKSGKLEICHV